MKIEKVNIMNLFYTVEEKENVINNGQEVLGLTNNATTQILISNSNNEIFKYKVLLHECIHALDYNLNLGFDEDTVVRLEGALWSLIRSNPDFILEILKR